MKSHKAGTPQTNALRQREQLKELEQSGLEKRGVEGEPAAVAQRETPMLTRGQFERVLKATGVDPGAVMLPTTHASQSALLQAVSLRAKPTKPPKTAGAGAALLALDVARLKEQKKTYLLSPKLAGLALAMLLFAGNVNELGAQTVFVNVNGAKVTQAEVMGAKTAARQAGESFTMVRPGELAGVLEQANAPDGKLRKLVVSGHSSGLWISGSDEVGSHSLGFDDMQKHASAYPSAFAKVQSFFAMACNVGTEENSRQWMTLFPNANAVVGFDNIGPASDKAAAGAVLALVDAELQKVNFKTLTRDGAMLLGRRLSNLPGVNVTEFAIRLKANDGSSVYFSKKNKPTSLTTAQDLVSQLRTSAFTPYFDAATPQFARPPAEHGANNPLRAFYNATQSLLNALGREITASGQNPAQDTRYQEVEADKEAALRLIYFDVVQQNAEFHMRPRFDAVIKELQASGVPFEIPKLTRLTRTETVEIGKKLAALGNYTWSDFATKYGGDIAEVNAWVAKHESGPIQLEHVKPDLAEWQLNIVNDRLDAVLSSAEAPAAVKEAAGRIKEALKSKPSENFSAVLRLFEDGLTKLTHTAFPADWVTTARPGV
jgi:hypothetical protein